MKIKRLSLKMLLFGASLVMTCRSANYSDVGDFRFFHELLGEGGYGKVVPGFHIHNGDQVVAKFAKPRRQKRVKEEAEIHNYMANKIEASPNKFRHICQMTDELDSVGKIELGDYALVFPRLGPSLESVFTTLVSNFQRAFCGIWENR